MTPSKKEGSGFCLAPSITSNLAEKLKKKDGHEAGGKTGEGGGEKLGVGGRVGWGIDESWQARWRRYCLARVRGGKVILPTCLPAFQQRAGGLLLFEKEGTMERNWEGATQPGYCN